MKKKLLVFGSTGLVGSSIVRLLDKDFKIIAPTRKQVDITNFSQIKNFINISNPDLIINSAGLTDMEKAEENFNLAYKVNAKSCEYITKCLLKTKIPYYYISTDAVFGDSIDNIPFKESDSLIAVSSYAKSKAKGEEITLKDFPVNCVIRITLPYSFQYKKKSDLVRDTIDMLGNKNFFSGISDQIINPLSIDDVVTGIKKILTKKASGIYHIAASNHMSNYDFVVQIAKTFSLEEKYINKIKLMSFQKDKKAYRSHYCVLGVERYQKDFEPLPSIEKSLEDFKKKYFE